MKAILYGLLAIVVSGCATSDLGRVGPGGAIYTYTRNADGSCSISMTSSREVAGGGLFITSGDPGEPVPGEDAKGRPGCTVHVSAKEVSAPDGATGILQSLVDRIPTNPAQ